jgi:hypothetical protein
VQPALFPTKTRSAFDARIGGSLEFSWLRAPRDFAEPRLQEVFFQRIVSPKHSGPLSTYIIDVSKGGLGYLISRPSGLYGVPWSLAMELPHRSARPNARRLGAISGRRSHARVREGRTSLSRSPCPGETGGNSKSLAGSGPGSRFCAAELALAALYILGPTA